MRTVQRWDHRAEDGRPGAVRSAPSNKLSEAERAQVLAIANEPGHASLAPHQIVPQLADQGVYVASESTFYRVLKAAGQQHNRGRARRPSARAGNEALLFLSTMGALRTRNDPSFAPRLNRLICASYRAAVSTKSAIDKAKLNAETPMLATKPWPVPEIFVLEPGATMG